MAAAPRPLSSSDSRQPLLWCPKRISQGARYQQEIALDHLFADVSEFVQVCMHPGHVRHVIDRAFKTALTMRGVATIIVPEDVQEEKAQPAPPKEHGASAWGPIVLSTTERTAMP